MTAESELDQHDDQNDHQQGADPADPADPVADEPRGSGRSTRLLVVALVAIAAIVAGTAMWIAARDESSGDLEVVIPAGTGEQIDAGEDVALIADRVELDVGSTMVVTNEDDRPHQIGDLTVRPDETLEYTFAEAGMFANPCSVHPSNSVTFVIT